MALALRALGVVWLLCAPRLAFALDVPPLNGRINDLGGVIPAPERAKMEERLAAHERATGQQFAVLVIPSLQGEPIENYALHVAETWKIGQKGKDNGLLLLVATQDRKVRIEVGYGLEGQVTDALSARIIRNVMAPAFRQQDYARGIDGALEALINAASGGKADVPEDSPPSASSHGGDGPIGVIFVLLIAAGFIIVPILLGMRSVFGGRRRGLWSGDSWSNNSWSSGSSFGGGGFFGGSSDSSSSSSGDSGGGFSGGGGSFGGGGASDSW